jgi:two-component system phosphate regulon sensor histidine kinase PhoR
MPEGTHKRLSGSSSRRRTRRGILTGSMMILAILMVTGFQGYWLKNNYDREKENLAITTNAAFKETVEKLQSSKMKLDKLTFQLDTIRVTGNSKADPRVRRTFNRKPPAGFSPNKTYNDKESVITLMSLLQQKIQDSLKLGDSLHRRGILTFKSGEGHKVWIDSSISVDRDGNRLPPMFIPMLDSLTGGPENIRSVKVNSKDKNGKVVSIIYKESHTTKDSVSDTPNNVFFTREFPGTVSQEVKVRRDSASAGKPMNDVFRFFYSIDSIFAKDSVKIDEITAAYTTRLEKEDIKVPFTVIKLDSTQPKSPDAVTIGFTIPVSFELKLGNTLGYMLNKLKLPILFSLLLVGLIIAAFLLLYRNMIRQKRLAEIKNDLISNISHELKTPIATVGVALEALKSFNAMHNPERTKEYIEISQGELHRLNLLVDKVLKLSIFEKKDIELKKERFDYKQLTAEIMNSMKLQFEKYHAKISMHTEGDSFYIDADKLHITSVIYNLLDNALKYSTENPVINVRLDSDPAFVKLIVEDNGIGIPAEYKSKVFEKFFRVPTGDRHNIKGYGLGLSYVAEVVKRHKGEITVDSVYGKGSTFTVALPIAKTPVVKIDSSYGASSKTAADKE